MLRLAPYRPENPGKQASEHRFVFTQIAKFPYLREDEEAACWLIDHAVAQAKINPLLASTGLRAGYVSTCRLRGTS